MGEVATRGAARDIAFTLFTAGKRPSDPEVKALGLKPKTTYNYFQIWKKEQGTTPKTDEGSPEGSPEGSQGNTEITPLQPRRVVGGKAVEVGKITITPENWGMTQYGAILILDTYNKAKQDLSYGGTIGDFLADICEFYRRVLNYKEVEYAGDSEGGGGTEKNGEQGAGRSTELVQG